jgi:hypothetical protein
MTTPAYSKLPTAYFTSGYASSGGSVSIPASALNVTNGDVRATLSSGNAATDGDVAEILLCLLNKVYSVYAAGVAPTKWSMSRSSSASGTTGNISFGISFQTSISDPPTQTVQDEPPTV